MERFFKLTKWKIFFTILGIFLSFWLCEVGFGCLNVYGLLLYYITFSLPTGLIWAILYSVIYWFSEFLWMYLWVCLIFWVVRKIRKRN